MSKEWKSAEIVFSVPPVMVIGPHRDGAVAVINTDPPEHGGGLMWITGEGAAALLRLLKDADPDGPGTASNEAEEKEEKR